MILSKDDRDHHSTASVANGDELEINPRAGLTKMRRLATGLLILMVLVFVGSTLLIRYYPWLAIVRAFSEAAMVGALADWFAVTALFRHPLGIPIPHTAIVPNNKARIGRSLGGFIEKNFLSENVLETQRISIAAALSRWLEHPGNRSFVVGRLRVMLPRFIEALSDDDVNSLIKNTLMKELQGVDAAKLAGDILSVLTVNDTHEALLDEAFKLSRAFFHRNKPWIRSKLREASPWFVPDFVEERIFESIVSKTESTLTDALTDRNHELRKKVHEAMQLLIVELRTNPEYRQKGREIKGVVLQNPIFLEYFASLRHGIVSGLKSDLTKENSWLIGACNRGIESFSRALSTDTEFRDKTDRALRRTLGLILGAHRNDIADTIAKIVESWDTGTIVDRLEEQVGRDLQYIRINGTLVGGLVGVLIYAANLLLLQ